MLMWVISGLENHANLGFFFPLSFPEFSKYLLYVLSENIS